MRPFNHASNHTPYSVRRLPHLGKSTDQPSTRSLSTQQDHVNICLTARQDHFHSSFALDQLTEVSERVVPKEFVLLMAPIFGLDIPPHSYIRLHEALKKRTIKNPEYEVVEDGNFPADYDNGDRTIRIHAAALKQVIEYPAQAWELLTILLHEFGHHLDNVLRRDLAEGTSDTPNPADDAPLEEGSKYAHFMASYDVADKGDICIARYSPTQDTELSITICHTEAMSAISHSQDPTGQQSQDPRGDRENFEAGGHDSKGHSHVSLAQPLGKLGFPTAEIAAIYFGNWLRDHSQLLDPKLVRGPHTAKSFPALLSRQALTEVVDILAARTFGDARSFYPEVFKVTTARLGVYRPSQHIDNPKVENPKPKDILAIDSDFEPWVEAGHPWLEVDYERSMKRHIHRSVGVMQEELGAAMEARRSGDGMRLFGAGLHILEDFFAHSNFVELSLIKQGYDTVLPWTSPAPCKWNLPLVTGRFGGSDVIASLALPIAKVLTPISIWTFTPTKPGDRTDSERMMLVLLGELADPGPLDAFKFYLDVRDNLSKDPRYARLELAAWLITTPARLLANSLGIIAQDLARWIGNMIDDVQSLHENPNINGSTDPTHSQLAKDHPEHPFHYLAGQLAQVAVEEVAKAMVNHWEYRDGSNPMALATAYFAHPQDTTWQDEIVARWARENPDLIAQGSNVFWLENLQKGIREAAKVEQDGLLQAARTFQTEITNFIKFIDNTLNPDLSNLPWVAVSI